MSPETLERLDQMRRNRRVAYAVLLVKASAPMALFALVWWVTR